jgi:hypothetical protein|tara:strand:+ start:94 stop:780 length:687 start_codon:yes stop_codon:yes gene_type:complete
MIFRIQLLLSVIKLLWNDDIKQGLRMIKSFFTSTTYGHTKELIQYADRVYDEKEFNEDVILQTAAPLASKLSMGVVDERTVRAAAGITMLGAIIVFCVAYFYGAFLPITLFSTYSFIDFFLRVFVGVQYSPSLYIGRFIIRNLLGQQPDWVSAIPKRFAWSIGIILTGTVTLLFWSGNNGLTSQLICLVCVLFTWMESTLGYCAGCHIYKLLKLEPERCQGDSCSRIL